VTPEPLIEPLIEVESPASALNEKEGRKRNSRKKPLTEFPSSWKPNDTDYAHGQGHGFSRAEIDRSAGKFKGHYIAKGAVWADWHQDFRNWLDKDAEFLGRKPRNGSAANGSAGDLFPAYSDSPNWQAWRTHARDAGQNAFVRLLDLRALEGRAYSFDSEWPPGHP
jgi:hypothetical protein